MLPKVVAEGRREASRILDGLSEENRITLQTSELVVPSRESNLQDLWKQVDEEARHAEATKTLAGDTWRNRMVYGDNLLVMQALLAGDPSTGVPSLRGKVDLIYIDPPFDSKADYRARIELPGATVESRPTVIEQFAYADTWAGKVDGEEVRGTLAYLRYMYPRLVLMRELLSEQGSIYVHIDWHVGHYVKLLLDDILGKENFINEIVWRYRRWPAKTPTYQKMHDTIFWYKKDKVSLHTWNQPYDELAKSTLETWGTKRQVADFSSGRRTPSQTNEETLGAPMSDVWDISVIAPIAKETAL